MRLPYLVLLCAVALLAGCQSMQIPSAEKANIRRTLHTFQLALNARSFATLEPLLAPAISLGGAGPELSRPSLQEGAAWVPFHVDDIQILSLQPTPAGPVAKVAMYSATMVSTSRLGFDAAGLIRSIDAEPIFKAPEVRVPNVLTAPFVVSGGLMFVKASVNGRTGYMLLDTGASSLLLSPKYFVPGASPAMGVSFSVNGIKKSRAPVEVRSLVWQGLRVSGINGQLHDFSNMEKPAVTPLLGAISHDQLKNCALVVDWKRQTVQVFATRSDGRRKAALAEPAPTVRIPFTYYTHLPLFPIRIGGVEYRMLFDSGAAENLLPSTAAVQAHARPIGHLASFSDGGRPVAYSCPIVAIDQTQIGSATFRDLPYIIYELPYLPGKGFLGAPLLQAGRVEINFRAKQISIWQ